MDPITLVSGLPRSGTSLMMRMLELGGIPPLTDRVRAPDESNPRGYYELEAVKKTKQDPGWLKDAPGKAVKVISLLLADLPRNYLYRVLLMRRELSEIVASQTSMLGRMGRKGGGLPPAQLEHMYAKQLAATDALLASRPEFSVLQVSYNELVAHPAESAVKVAQFLGGTMDTGAMAGAVDPALYRERRVP